MRARFPRGSRRSRRARSGAGEGVDDAVFAGLASELARAHWRNAEPPENVLPWAEKALIAAERLGLAPVIAESLNTKAGAMADVGRLQEALALTRGAASGSATGNANSWP